MNYRLNMSANNNVYLCVYVTQNMRYEERYKTNNCTYVKYKIM